MATEQVAVPSGAAAQPQRLSLLRVLGPMHVWALGVGIVLVGEFMGWNFTVAKGGVFGGLVACWFSGILYSCVAMIDSEVSSTVASAGGQYAQAKHILGPLAAFNIALFIIFEYCMLGGRRQPRRRRHRRTASTLSSARRRSWCSRSPSWPG